MKDPDVQAINQLFGQNSQPPQVSTDPDVQNINKIFSQSDNQVVNADPWTNFTQKAKDIASKENFPASVLLGQASLETGKGTSDFAKTRNNYFGMNAIDSNPGQATSYSSPDESIKDYINLIKNTPRYSWAYNQYLQDKDAYKLLANIKASGYATDPNYVQKVSSLPEFVSNLTN